MLSASEGDMDPQPDYIGTLILWDIQARTEIITLDRGRRVATKFCFSPDGHFFACAGEFDKLSLWHAGTHLHPKLIASCSLKHNSPKDIKFSMDSRFLLVQSEDGDAIWEILGDPPALSPSNASAKFFVPAGPRLSVRIRDFHFVDLLDQALLASNGTEKDRESVSGVTVWPGRQHLLSWGFQDTSERGFGGVVKTWDAATAHLTEILYGHRHGVCSVVGQPGGRFLVSASQGEIVVWNIETRQAIHRIEGGAVRARLAMAPDGRHFIASNQDCSIGVWELRTGQLLHMLEGHTDSITSLAIASDGTRAVSSSWDHTLRVWDLGTKEPIHTLKGHKDWVESFALFKTGDCLISASADGTLKLWDMSKGNCIRTMGVNGQRQRFVVLLPDDRYAISVSDDCSVRMWDLQTWKAQVIFSGQPHFQFADASLAPDGRRLALATYHRELLVLDLQTGENLDFSGEDRIGAVTFLPDGKGIVAGDHGGRLYFLSIDVSSG